MHHKFTQHGKSTRANGCAAAIDYLLGERDHKGDLRPDIQVLRGDPYSVAAVADTLDFSRTYTSGVISWAPEEVPTETEIEAVLTDWEALAFAGLAPDRYAFTAVLHREDNGGVHVHTITARVDLETGKALNIAPPGHLRDFDAFRDKWNHEKGWARPDDPLRKRVVQPDFEAYKTPAIKPKLKTEITEHLLDIAAQGLILDAKDVRQYLTESLDCEITRSGKDYLSIKPEGATRAIRLKGEMYGEGWTAQATLEREVKADASQRAGRGGEVDKARADEAQREFEAACQRRAKYNRNRYLRAKSGHQLAIKAAEPSVNRTQPDAEKDASLNRERDPSHQAGLSRGIAADAEPDHRRGPEPSQGKPEAVAERGGGPAFNNDKSVAETLANLVGNHRRTGAGRVWDSGHDGPDLRQKNRPDQPDKSGDRPSQADLERLTERDHVRGARGQEIHTSEEDKRPFQSGRGEIQGPHGRGDRVNDGIRTAVEAPAPTEPAASDYPPSRSGNLTNAIKRLKERMGALSDKLFGAVQRTAEKFRGIQAADRKRTTGELRDVQAADRERLSELTRGSKTAGGQLAPDVEQSREQLAGLNDATERLNEAAKTLEKATPALVKHLEKQRSRNQGPGMEL